MPRRSVVKYTPEQKRESVVNFCERGGSAEKSQINMEWDTLTCISGGKSCLSGSEQTR